MYNHEKKKCRVGNWFSPTVNDWLKEDLNASWQL